MQVAVRLFGSLREGLGAKELSVELRDGATVADLRVRLASQHEAVERLGDRVRVAVNRAFAPDEAILGDGDEVAFLPPVSGGAGSAGDGGICTISERPLDVGKVVARVAGPGRGGVVTFLGTVRDRARGRDIERLEYEAYAEMAEPEMERIAAEAAERWPGVRVAIAHRVGSLAVGEIAVVVVAAAPHRGEAFEACRFAIDTLKLRVPIWKKELTTEGDYWVEGHA